MSRRRRKERGLNQDRIFSPAAYGFPESAVPSDILDYDYGAEVSSIQVPGRRNKRAIFIKGRCRGNGTEKAKAAIGVYHGRDSTYNCKECLPNGVRHTNQVAEIWAALKAVEQVRDYRMDISNDFDGVVFITNSEYLYKSMTQHINKWLKNGFKNAQRGLVANREVFSDLEKLIFERETHGSKIQFWQVPKKYNQDTNRLANEALGPRRSSLE